jgi:hypothetical protein
MPVRAVLVLSPLGVCGPIGFDFRFGADFVGFRPIDFFEFEFDLSFVAALHFAFAFFSFLRFGFVFEWFFEDEGFECRCRGRHGGTVRGCRQEQRCKEEKSREERESAGHADTHRLLRRVPLAKSGYSHALHPQ